MVVVGFFWFPPGTIVHARAGDGENDVGDTPIHPHTPHQSCFFPCTRFSWQTFSCFNPLGNVLRLFFSVVPNSSAALSWEIVCGRDLFYERSCLNMAHLSVALVVRAVVVAQVEEQQHSVQVSRVRNRLGLAFSVQNCSQSFLAGSFFWITCKRTVHNCPSSLLFPAIIHHFQIYQS